MRCEKRYKSEWSPGCRIVSDLRSPGMPSASLMKMPCHAAQRMALHDLAAPKALAVLRSAENILSAPQIGLRPWSVRPIGRNTRMQMISFAWGKTCGVYITQFLQNDTCSYVPKWNTKRDRDRFTS